MLGIIETKMCNDPSKGTFNCCVAVLECQAKSSKNHKLLRDNHHVEFLLHLLRIAALDFEHNVVCQ